MTVSQVVDEQEVNVVSPPRKGPVIRKSPGKAKTNLNNSRAPAGKVVKAGKKVLASGGCGISWKNYSSWKWSNFGGNPREEEGREKNERVTRSKVSKAAMNEENQEPQRSTRTFSKKNTSTTSLTKSVASPRVQELAAKVLSPKRKSSIANSIRKVSAARKGDEGITSC